MLNIRLLIDRAVFLVYCIFMYAADVILTHELLPPRWLFFRLCLSVCLLTGLLKKTIDQIFMKFYGIVGHNPGTNRFDFGDIPRLDPDPGIF